MSTVAEYLRSANSLGHEDVRDMNIEANNLMEYLGSHPNKTQSIVVFCSNSSWRVGDL
jgi:hypothetical protein